MDSKLDQERIESFTNEEKFLAEVRKRARKIESEEPHREQPFKTIDWIIIAFTAVLIPGGVMVWLWLTAPAYY